MVERINLNIKLEEINFEDIGKIFNSELNIIAKKNIEKYNNYFDKISCNNQNNFIWWFSSVASRNPHQTQHYLNFCKIILLTNLIENNIYLKNILVPDETIKNIIVKIVNENNKKINVIYKKKYLLIKKNLNNLYFCLKSLKYLFNSRLLYLFFNKNFTIPKNKINIFEIYDSDNFDGINRYYPNINKYIINDKETYFYTDILSNRFNHFYKITKNLISNENNYIIKNIHLRIIDLFIFIYHYFFNLKKINLNSNNFIYDQLTKYELKKHYFSEMHFKSFLNFQVLKRLKKKGLKINIFIDWWENQPIDKSICYSISRLFPNCLIKAHLGYIPRENEYQLSPLDIEIRAKVVPELFLISGIEVSKTIKKFCNYVKCEVIASLRYLNILQNFNYSSQKVKISKEDKNIIIGLTIYREESIYILKCVKKYISLNKSNVKIFIKCHPANIIDVKSFFNLNNNVKIFNEFIFDKQFNFAITGMSTVSYELLTFGIPIIVCNESNNFNYLPDLSNIDQKFWRITSNQKEFNKSFDYFLYENNFKIEQKNKLSAFVKSNYFEYKNLDTIESFYL